MSVASSAGSCVWCSFGWGFGWCQRRALCRGAGRCGGLLGAVGSGGQPHREGRAAVLLAPDRDIAAVVGADVLDDGQPEAGATRGARARGVDAVEALEDPVL